MADHLRHRFLSGLLLALTTPAWATPDCANPVGEWLNEGGSLLEITAVADGGRLEGRYHSSTGTDGSAFPMQGWFNRAQDDPSMTSLAWSVRWEGYGSITSWTGACSLDDNGPHIKTMWHLVRPGQDYDWERVITNSSTFRPRG